jgi:ferric-dicitrate binding protein FerR (iron transport regulator)
MVPSPGTRRGKAKRQSGSMIAPLCLLCLFILPQPSESSYTQAASQEQQKEPLGSLSSIGEVYVNGSAAPVESTIFPGDSVRTGGTGTATFTVSGKGTLKISPRSEVVFPGSYQFTAELKSGTVVLNSISGPSGITLRVENFVLVASVRQQSVTARIEGAANGSFLVSCLDGSVGVLTMESKSGQFLSAGQSLRISAGETLSFVSPATKATAPNFHSGWLLLGLGGAGAAAAAAGLGHGGGRQSISPSVP